MESGPGAALLEERERDWATSLSRKGKQSGKGDSVTSAIGGGGGGGTKWESRAWLMPSGVSWSGKRESGGVGSLWQAFCCPDCRWSEGREERRPLLKLGFFDAFKVGTLGGTHSGVIVWILRDPVEA